MTTVYLDPVGTAVTRSGTDEGTDGRSVLPGAVQALIRLCDARCEVVLLAKEPVAGLSGLEGLVTYDEAPAEVDPKAWRRLTVDRPWLVASDEGWVDRTRSTGVRTIRVGPRRAEGRRAGARFDLEARDLPAAVMEILVRDAMPR